jgi:hypothetical protein
MLLPLYPGKDTWYQLKRGWLGPKTGLDGFGEEGQDHKQLQITIPDMEMDKKTFSLRHDSSEQVPSLDCMWDKSDSDF